MPQARAAAPLWSETTSCWWWYRVCLTFHHFVFIPSSVQLITYIIFFSWKAKGIPGCLDFSFFACTLTGAPIILNALPGRYRGWQHAMGPLQGERLSRSRGMLFGGGERAGGRAEQARAVCFSAKSDGICEGSAPEGAGLSNVEWTVPYPEHTGAADEAGTWAATLGVGGHGSVLGKGLYAGRWPPSSGLCFLRVTNCNGSCKPGSWKSGWEARSAGPRSWRFGPPWQLR